MYLSILRMANAGRRANFDPPSGRILTGADFNGDWEANTEPGG